MASDTDKTTIDLLRHGACEGGEIFRGSTDVPLTEQGWAQMYAALTEHQGWDCVVSSSLQRCKNFAVDFAQSNALPLHVDTRFREIHFGEWEGQKIADIERDHGTSLWKFWNDPECFTPPNGESMQVFRARVIEAASSLDSEYRGKHILLISHGAVIRMLLCEWLQMPMTAFSTIAVPYASLSRVRLYQRGSDKPWPQLVFHRGE
ncbi:MAG TPA: histidine phosphatase family protein [Spongiibacteraceae bacterium]|nr:histidine phosphatase family protein [Spongiibacteraceae bacterium]